MAGAYNENKGSQAMMFTIVDHIKRKLPDKPIYVFSAHAFRREDKKRNYAFKILFYDLKNKINLLISRKKVFFSRKIAQNSLENTLLKVIENADRFINIRGYNLASYFPLSSSINYILDVAIAKKYAIPYYIFPQSIGPFDYPLKYKIVLYPLLKSYIRYPTKIFVREKEGLAYVSSFTKNNVEKTYDIVLQNEGYNLSNIYQDSSDIQFKHVKIDQNAVGIIPNLRIIEHIDPNEFYGIYKELINHLIDAKKKVYILRHTLEDLEICKNIKQLFPNNKNVRLIADDLTCIELENIIKQFDFVIASRYHSIVHSYKNGVPALVIGWATKYFELLETFDQQDFLIDIRNGIDVGKIDIRLDKLFKNYENERIKILDKMAIIRQNSMIDNLF